MSNEVIRLLPRFIKDINLVQPEFSLSDRVWQLPMQFGPNQKDWTMVHVTLYENTYYCYWTEWDLSLELSVKGKIKKPAFCGHYGTFLGFSDFSSSNIFHLCRSTICRPLSADSLAVEDAMFSFVDIERALIPNSRVPQ